MKSGFGGGADFVTWCDKQKQSFKLYKGLFKEKKSHKSYYILWRKKEKLKLSYLGHTLLHVVSMYVRVSKKHHTFFFVYEV